MTLDWDGKIRMDPSSPFAMARLVELRDRFDLAMGNDADADRHGIVVPGVGLMNPNHVIAAAINYLFGGGRAWGADVAVGKTLVSSSIIDRVTASLGRRLLEVPVGFKWFVDGLVDGSVGFGGEESAGASFLRLDGTVWTTDKDGLIACLLAAELTARTGKNPAETYAGLTERFGAPAYRRIDAPATPEVEGRAGPPLARGRDRDHAGRRPDHRQADPRPRQRRADRRPQGHHGPGLVRRAPVRHRERDQALRGVVPWRGAPGAGSSTRRARSWTPPSDPFGWPPPGPVARWHIGRPPGEDEAIDRAPSPGHPPELVLARLVPRHLHLPAVRDRGHSRRRAHVPSMWDPVRRGTDRVRAPRLVPGLLSGHRRRRAPPVAGPSITSAGHQRAHRRARAIPGGRRRLARDAAAHRPDPDRPLVGALRPRPPLPRDRASSTRAGTGWRCTTRSSPR